MSCNTDVLSTYDDEDLKLVREDDVFVKCFLRAFYGKEILMENAVKNIDSVLKFRKDYAINGMNR